MRIIILALIFFVTSVSAIYADEVSVGSITTYDFDATGTARVTQDITINNGVSGKYASDFILNLNELDPINVSANEDQIPLSVSLIEDGPKKSIFIGFTKKSIGQENVKNFQVKYDLLYLAKKSGEVWEVSIPKLSEDNVFDEYVVRVAVPKSFGEEAYVNPQPLVFESLAEKNIYTYNREQLLQSQVTGAFGNLQSYQFDIVYHLENPLNQPTLSEVAIPPDTNYQRSLIQKIDPLPHGMRQDEDGNWLAVFNLKARQQLDVRVLVEVDVFPISKDAEIPNADYLQKLTNPTQLWAYDSIYSAAIDLKSPRDIYTYVLDTLSYDYQSLGTNNKRLGAINALTHPASAICTDYSDLTISLFRRAGIPAREVQGYAYSQNKLNEPIALVEDVLHSWVEYWDSARSMWIQIDPTWGDTSGEDYFDNFDLKHVAFVRHGVDPFKPYPAGSYNYGSVPQKDVLASTLTIGTKVFESSSIRLKLTNIIPALPSNLSIEVRNTGNTAIYDEKLRIYHDGVLVEEVEIGTLLPFGAINVETQMPFSLSASKLPEKVTLAYASNTLDVPTSKNITTYLNIITVVLFLFVVLTFLIYKAKNLRK